MKRSIRQAITVSIAVGVMVGLATHTSVSNKYEKKIGILQAENAAIVEKLNKAQNEIGSLREQINKLVSEKEESERMALSTVPQDELHPVIVQAAKDNGLPVELLVSLGHIESNWDCTLIGRDQDTGCLQILPETGAWAFRAMPNPPEDNDLLNPTTNIRAGAWILRTFIEMEHGDVARGLATYNGGIDAWDRKPSTTRGYAARVLNRAITSTTGIK